MEAKKAKDDDIQLIPTTDLKILIPCSKMPKFKNRGKFKPTQKIKFIKYKSNL